MYLQHNKKQERIKDAWSFSSGNRELTTTVNFAIGPDGKLKHIFSPVKPEGHAEEVLAEVKNSN